MHGPRLSALDLTINKGFRGYGITRSEIPSHSHSTPIRYAANSGSTAGHGTAWTNLGGTYVGANAAGGDGAHNNMPPYLAVYMWKRTA